MKLSVSANEGTTFDFQWHVDHKLVHSLHTSERRSFKGCRRRWDWIFREYWYPQTNAKPLDFGVAYHKAMEVLYEPETWLTTTADQKRLAAREAFVDKCTEQFRKFESSTMTGASQEVLEDYTERTELGLGMIDYYVQQLLPLEKDLMPVKVEVSFEVPIVDPDTNKQLMCKCLDCWRRFTNWVLNREDGKAERGHFYNELGYDVNLLAQALKKGPVGHGDVIWSKWSGNPVTYGGRIDVLMQGADGRYWILDWKSAARLSGDRDEYLLLDDQIGSYCWALWLCGIRVAGFLYHEQKKGFPQEPEPNKTQRLGRWYSVSKQMDTSAQLYEETVREGDPEAYDAGLYDSHIRWLKEEGSKYHHRYKVHRNTKELEQIGRMIYHEASDMTDPNLRIYPNAGKFSCGFCAFRQPCLGVNSQEDYLYTLTSLFDKRKRHYWEDTEASTDGKAGQ